MTLHIYGRNTIAIL